MSRLSSGERFESNARAGDGAVEGVGFHEATAFLGYLFGDVDFVGEQDRAITAHGFSDGDAEVFLMRGEDEGFGGAKRLPT